MWEEERLTRRGTCLLVERAHSLEVEADKLIQV